MIQLEGSRVLGGIFYCSQMCRAHYIIKMSGSISMGLIFTYSLMIQHGANKYDIMTIAKHAHKLLYGVTDLVISFNKVFRDSLPEAFFIQMRINKVELIIPQPGTFDFTRTLTGIGSCHRHMETIIVSEFVPCFSYMIIAWEQSWTPTGSAFIDKWQHIDSMDINHFQHIAWDILISHHWWGYASNFTT